MRTIVRQEILSAALRKVKAVAMYGYFDGQNMTPYFNECRWWIEHFQCQIIFTRDIGYHSSGWWKNPDYERCYHLSISFPGGKNKNGLEKIIDGLFGPDKNKIWVESPYSDIGKSKEVWHYRLFCDEQWLPIIPRGEVYSTQFTERGWKSFSEATAVKDRLQAGSTPFNNQQP